MTELAENKLHQLAGDNGARLAAGHSDAPSESGRYKFTSQSYGFIALAAKTTKYLKQNVSH